MRVARAPGRVNLIGEHIDYNGLPVLPMALDRETVLRFQPRSDGRVLLRNVDSRFPPTEFQLGPDIAPDAPGSWGNYPRAAAQILWRETGPLTGLEGEVSSDVPIASGLSSSTALVVVTGLALLDASGRNLPRERLMELLAEGERYVGVRGGGMDQAISLGGRPGHGLRIDFRPTLRLRPVPIPPDWRIVVASSMVAAAKAAGARDAYNTRVSECRQALDRVGGKPMGGTPPQDYQQLLGAVPVERALALGETLLPDLLFRRFRHVVTEAGRVDQAEAALRAADLAEFGRVLHASHRSLRDDYQVSAPELDQLVEIAERAGAAGARLTGAGFGGCIIAAATVDTAPQVMAALRREYYQPRGLSGVDDVLFVATPSGGAGVGPGD